MLDLMKIDQLRGFAEQAQTWLRENLLVVGSLVQLALIATALVIALLAGRMLAKWLRLRSPGNAIAQRMAEVMATLALPIVWLILQWTAILVMSSSGQPHHLLRLVASLLTAWVFIRLFTSLGGETVWTRLLAWTAWTIAALNIVGLLTPATTLLDSVAVTMGEVRISPYFVIKVVLSLALMLWAASYIAAALESRISSSRNLSPSLQVLISKLLKVTLLGLAVVLAISMVGIDITALTVFGGAVGLGIGFGLQKVIANLISGLILLVDKSIKPGDVIAVDDTYGWVNSLGGRYVSVITRDGIEHLIPNETMITERVENWSHSNSLLRIRIPVGVHYQSNVRLAQELCLQAAAASERVLADPAPVCLLTAFGDSSVDLEIRLWINDPYNGVSNMKSDVMFRVWDLFHENNIEIPYPQRDFHLRSPQDLIDGLAGR